MMFRRASACRADPADRTPPLDRCARSRSQPIPRLLASSASLRFAFNDARARLFRLPEESELAGRPLREPTRVQVSGLIVR
jgi:hypothetical protein